MSKLKEVDQQLRDLRMQKKQMLAQKKENSEERKRLVALRAETRARIMENKKNLAAMIRHVPSLLSDPQDIYGFHANLLSQTEDLAADLLVFRDTVEQLDELS